MCLTALQESEIDSFWPTSATFVEPLADPAPSSHVEAAAMDTEEAIEVGA